LTEEHQARLATMCSRIRPLTSAELETLEKALGAPVDRDHLAHWLSLSIQDTVRSARYPSPRELRDALLTIERHGRQLLASMDAPNLAIFLGERTDLAKFRTAAAQFCDQIVALAREVDAVVGPGRSRTPAALEGFVDRMIGIAKTSKVLPSTPSRRENRRTAVAPAFFGFLLTALRIARQVIKTSPLPEDVKAAAASKLQHQSREALIETINKVRGNIGNYRETSHGLIERTVTEPDRD
jgi:hypothetical protein